jgi:hypothetical protein
MSSSEPAANASPSVDPAEGAGAGWGAWLAWTWVALILLACVAEVAGIEPLRLALDLQRSFAAGTR